MLALDTVYLLPGFLIVLEGVLTVLLIALLGAAGYVLLIYSMKDDRAEKIAKLYYTNPWDSVNRQAAGEEPKKPRRKKSVGLGIALLLAAVAVLALLLWVMGHA
ncbi:MAG: hypothetical protein J6K29_09135 [Clostridia bacterium]|nr:hypothetical protein [Clostridia bacterium]